MEAHYGTAAAVDRVFEVVKIGHLPAVFESWVEFVRTICDLLVQ